MPKMSSISGNQLQIIKLCVNLNSAILRCRAVIPSADIGEPSAVFNLAVVGCMGVYNSLQCSYMLSILIVIWQHLNLLMPCTIFLHVQLW